QREPKTMRLLEELDIPSDRLQDALTELDELIRGWADKFHQKGREPTVLQMVVGPRDDSFMA
ncbi:MAG: heterocyst differentiation control protein, partial [Sodalinema sp.]